MKTPAIILPVNAMDAVDTSGQPSPLGRFLASVIVDSRGHNETSVKHEAAQGLMQAALVLACQFPFSTDETIEVGPHKSKLSLLQAVLALAQNNRPQATARTWPATIEQFGESGQATAVDCEWVAAALVRAGCNPWKMHDGVPAEVDRAIFLGMTGLVEVLFSIEGAPHSDRVLVDQESNRVRQIGLLVRDPFKAGMIDALTRDGIGHWHIDEDMITELVFARPECVAVLVKNGLDLSNPKIKSQISRGWLDRVKNNCLEPEACASMQEIAFGNTAQGMDASSLMVAQVLAVEWGSQANGSSARAYGFMSDTGADVLCGKGSIRRGQMAGQWSVLAAAVMSRMRQANSSSWLFSSSTEGCLGWAVRQMVSRRNDKTKQLDSINPQDPSMKGILADAIGFEWNKGISIDGIMVLGLWGQEDNKESDQAERIVDFGLLSGIDDLGRWSAQSAAHAAAFTCSIIKPNTTSVASAMTSTWVRALEQCPKMLAGIDDTARVDLMYSLTCMFNLAEQWSNGTGKALFQKLAEALFKGISSIEMIDGKLKQGPRREAALIIALVDSMHSSKPNERRDETISHILEQLARPGEQGGATPREKTFLKAWAKAHGKDGIMKVEADAVAMQIETSRTQPENERRGPRF